MTQALSRERLVAAALALVQDEGLDGLSMRALAERLDVKASSLYWHVRDRKELLELVGESFLESVPRPRSPDGEWRAGFVAVTAALGDRAGKQNDAARILLEVPEVFTRSEVFGALKGHLVSAGVPEADASEVALMAMTYVIAGRAPRTAAKDFAAGDEPAELAIDSGSAGSRSAPARPTWRPSSGFPPTVRPRRPRWCAERR